MTPRTMETAAIALARTKQTNREQVKEYLEPLRQSHRPRDYRLLGS